MYYPYFRAKQNELIAIRDLSQLIAANNFVPIIEPVKEQLSGLIRTLDSLRDASAEAIVVVNPKHGDLRRRNDPILDLLRTRYSEYQRFGAGVLLDANTEIDDFPRIREPIVGRPIALIHCGFMSANTLAESVRRDALINTSVFLESDILYRRHFRFHQNRILLNDGFTKRVRNSDHPNREFFSSLHLTYEEEGATGFGDFQIVGDEYSESGGPAYTVAIHLTYIDDDDDSKMYVRHFKSDRQDTPTDPGGKFLEALSKLVEYLNGPNCKIYETEAIREFRALYARNHFPGLGSVKKLSMKHHIETFARFLGDN